MKKVEALTPLFPEQGAIMVAVGEMVELANDKAERLIELGHAKAVPEHKATDQKSDKKDGA